MPQRILASLKSIVNKRKYLIELQFSLHKCPKPSWQGFRPPLNQANACLNLVNSSLKKCPKPSGQGLRPPPPYGQCPNRGGAKFKGASLKNIGNPHTLGVHSSRGIFVTIPKNVEMFRFLLDKLTAFSSVCNPQRMQFLEDVQVFAGLGYHLLLRLQAHLQQCRPAVGQFKGSSFNIIIIQLEHLAILRVIKDVQDFPRVRRRCTIPPSSTCWIQIASSWIQLDWLISLHWVWLD